MAKTQPSSKQNGSNFMRQHSPPKKAKRSLKPVKLPLLIVDSQTPTIDELTDARCELCERWVVARHDRGDLLCTRCGLVL